MSWSAVMFGELTFPDGALAQWKDLAIEADLYDDAWARSKLMGDPTAPDTVAGLLGKLGRWYEGGARGPDHLVVRVEKNRVSLRACINEDDFRGCAGDVATMLRLAAGVGARGEYVAVASDDMTGERLVLEGTSARFEPVDLLEAMSGEAPQSELDYSAIVAEIFEATRALSEDPPPEKVTKPRASKRSTKSARRPSSR